MASVTRDNVLFFDHRGLYVVQNNQRYTRAPDSHLYDLLTWTDTGPVLTKKGIPAKRQPRPHKDESTAYYISQMILYGLKPLKTRPAAKKALLAAFGSGRSLSVSEKVNDVENELKELWRVENEKAQVRYEQGREERGKLKAAAAKKELERRADIKFKRVAILAEFGEDESSMKAGPSRKRKATDDGNAPLKKVKVSDSGKKLPDTECKGEFAIVAPYLAEQWPQDASDNLKLTLSPSRGTGKHLWGSFNFGVVKGIIRGGAPPTTTGGTVTFKWRGYETGEGEMQFDDDNKGTLTFLGNGKVRGTMEGGFMEKFNFLGLQDHETLHRVVWGKRVERWKDEWRSINDNTYGAASVSRWGGWSGGDDYTEKPADSDTPEPEDIDEDDEGEESEDDNDETW
ncbi:hypothetical protein PENSPDRAFT_736316 [Peniophora sp. CONT]|nr:hypothetical protein PENSPDRAFT_736316 [Peniophora sp. CONT]